MSKYYKTLEWKQLLKHLRENDSTLTILDLKYNGIDSKGITELTQALQKNSYVTTLHLSWNNIQDDGVKLLCDLLENNSTVTTLNLEFNEFGITGAKALSQLLEKTSSLRALYLQDNLIGPDGIISLNQALEKNTTLFKLSIGHIHFQPDKNIVNSIVIKLKRNGDRYIAANFQIQQLLKKAEKGDPDSQFQLGKKYEMGNDGFEENNSKALEWFLKAAKQDHLESQTWVGEWYIGRQNQTALKWLEKAAKKTMPVHFEF